MRKEGNCLYCGKHVVQVFRGRDRSPGKIFCCREHAILLKDRKNYEQAQAQIVTAIKHLRETLHRVPTITELRLYTGKSKNTLAKHKYDTKRLKQMFGQKFSPRREYKKCSFQQAKTQCQKCLLEHKDAYFSNLDLRDKLNISMHYIDKMDLITFRKRCNLPTQPVVDAKALKAELISYIKSTGQYTPLRTLLDVFHMDYYATFVKLNCTIQELNSQAGFQKHYNSYGEVYLYRQLRQYFPVLRVELQKTFKDLLSPKGYPLRFDFYLPEYKIAIQVDGSQHRDPHNHHYSEYLVSRDMIKNDYAKLKGIKLIRVPFQTGKQFQEEAQKTIQYLLGIVKPVELLEHQENQKGVLLVNQQLSRERRQETESSETIEKGTTQMQLQF